MGQTAGPPEDHNKRGEEQGGSRPGRTAIDIANRKALTYYTRLTKLVSVLSIMIKIVLRSNYRLTRADSRSCPPGMPEVACRIHGGIDKMKHFIKTAGHLGILLLQRDEGPLFGSGQGSGGSPPLWLIVWVAMRSVPGNDRHVLLLS
jgi:hypothetical protein